MPNFFCSLLYSEKEMSSGETGTRDHGLPVREALAAGDKRVSAVARPARRRRLELRRLGRTASAAAEEEGAKRVRPVPDSSSDSADSAKVAPEPQKAAAARWPACVSHGAVSVIGRRREMEDAVAIAAPFLASAGAAGEDKGGAGEGGKEDVGEEGFFAVYDGHGGSQVAEACRERMHVVLAEEVVRLRQLQRGGADEDQDGARWKEAMAACFARVDGEVGGADEGDEDTGEQAVGSTAVVAVVGPRRIVVANCGDSRAVLSRGGVAVPLSSDHKPDRPDELERVEAAGGRVINWNGYRVLGVLATSRSIGDYHLKPYVTAEPEVTVMDRTDKDEFLILASDGLWDVVSNKVACKIARNCLSGRAASKYPESVSGSTATDAAALLVELAMSRGSKDNISVVVVELRRLKSRTASRQNGR
ncbi:probable protein phosphatase 2C 8 isoform X2 [Phragmites australis]|uniref:probable protein phosphatase 2C 8 isoform X2 n=1 Tax=Phragmites australis TaxID=29695 RepID=UPI002D783831|nr:probable protein phosphatase 2C 8 isoform X2 [Phragmites australis]